ncbi:polyferredoxin [Clostridium tetanomorphum]|uniref:4Fe-4S binding protein n=1 Tax=Clostridium tetanomorphum TaxID=1553 RepID=UPI00068B90BB|nr:4Fe-4S binding protein [Clostridium tetanomorphum]MBP1866618.1 polyferredoxin [Clostridium tetanomorphum]NRS86386.1 polyferredoxin [Clostridium tetanomorphum]
MEKTTLETTEVTIIKIISFSIIFTIAFIGMLVARFVCGFLCSFGLIQEIIYKVLTNKFKFPKWTIYI